MLHWFICMAILPDLADIAYWWSYIREGLLLTGLLGQVLLARSFATLKSTIFKVSSGNGSFKALLILPNDEDVVELRLVHCCISHVSVDTDTLYCGLNLVHCAATLHITSSNRLQPWGISTPAHISRCSEGRIIH